MRKLIAVIIGIFSINFSYSQTGDKHHSSESDVGNALNLYDQFFSNNAPLYNGREYVFYSFKMEGNPYFLNDSFSRGWVSYEGKKYDSIDMVYDLSRNELVILNVNKSEPIVLHNESVDSFGFSGYKFINLVKNEKSQLDYGGFYNLLFDGSIQILARRKKTINHVIENMSALNVFVSDDRFYIQKNGVYYPVTNSKDVYEIFSDKRKQLIKMMRRNNIKIKKNEFENSLVKAARFYDEINQ